MSEDTLALKGDKLRDALFVVWLANRYHDELSIADLAKISGYKSTGVYSAKEEGWFIEESGVIKLSEQGKSYVKNYVLKGLNSQLLLIYYLFLLALVLFVQSVAFRYYGLLIMPDPLGTGIGLAVILFLIAFYYRLYWIILKRKKNR
jgi:hypothetical protein